MSKISAPYLMRKRGIFYLQKRVPTQLIGRYGTQLIRKSLRTTDRKEAVRVASSLVAAMEKEWNKQILAVPDNDFVFNLFKKQTLSVPLLSEAGRFYVEMKGRADDKRFVRYTSRVISEVVGLAGDKMVSAYSRHALWPFVKRCLIGGQPMQLLRVILSAFEQSGILLRKNIASRQPIHSQI